MLGPGEFLAGLPEAAARPSAKAKRPWTAACLVDGLGLPADDAKRLRPLLRPPQHWANDGGGDLLDTAHRPLSIEAQAEAQREQLRRLREGVMAVARETRQPLRRAAHQDSCKRAVLVFFNFLSGGRSACSWEECAAVAEPGLRFSCPLLPALADAHADTYTRSWQGVDQLRDASTKVRRRWRLGAAGRLRPCTRPYIFVSSLSLFSSLCIPDNPRLAVLA